MEDDTIKVDITTEAIMQANHGTEECHTPTSPLLCSRPNLPYEVVQADYQLFDLSANERPTLNYSFQFDHRGG